MVALEAAGDPGMISRYFNSPPSGGTPHREDALELLRLLSRHIKPPLNIRAMAADFTRGLCWDPSGIYRQQKPRKTTTGNSPKRLIPRS